MSQTTLPSAEDITQSEELEPEKIKSTPIFLQPFHRQFSLKLVLLATSLLLIICFSAVLYYQLTQSNQDVEEYQIQPLKNQISQLENLQKNKAILDKLLTDEGNQNWQLLHQELLATNRYLLRLQTENSTIFQQWLNQNNAAKEVVARVEKNKSRNQQLKQSSIIQLELMLFSSKRYLLQQQAHEKRIFKQLQSGSITLSRAQGYTKVVKSLHNIEQVNTLISDILDRFERLTINTPQADFELLRLSIEQLFAQAKLLKAGNSKIAVELIEQIDSFKNIVYGEQTALAKWQGYLRLAQNYHVDLASQQKQTSDLLAKPQAVFSVSYKSRIGQFLNEYHIELNDKQIQFGIMLMIGFTVLLFLLILRQFNQHIKRASFNSFSLIGRSLHVDNTEDLQSDCAEVQTLIEQISEISLPEHSEEDYQFLSSEINKAKQLIESQKESLLQLTVENEHQLQDQETQTKHQINQDIQQYAYLKSLLLPQIIHWQKLNFNIRDLNEIDKVEQQILLLNQCYDTLEYFCLSSYLQSNDSIRILSTINLFQLLQSIFISKQNSLSTNVQRLFIDYDEQILSGIHVDVSLVRQLFNVLLELSFLENHNALFYLKISLKDKNSAQQVIHCSAVVYDEQLTNLSGPIQALNQDTNETIADTSLSDIFQLFLSKLHGENCIAKLTDGGYQIDFDIPLALADSHTSNSLTVKEDSHIALADIKIMLFSSQQFIKLVVEKIIKSNAGKCENIIRIDSFKQRVDAKKLSKHKLDLIIVSSEIAKQYLPEINGLIQALPKSLQPKLMVLQSPQLSYQDFGLYSQSEQTLCKDIVLQNIMSLLGSSKSNNLIIEDKAFSAKTFITSSVQVLFATSSIDETHDLQRLFAWLGLQVQCVSDEVSLKQHWKTGRYSLLVTDFSQHIFIDMSVKSAMPVAVFSLQDDLKLPEVSSKSDENPWQNWQVTSLSANSTLTELCTALAPWLKLLPKEQTRIQTDKFLADSALLEVDDENEQTVFINEVPASLVADANSEVSFDFTRYLQHQGSVELALFMLDEYCQDNHLQLTQLNSAIKNNTLIEAKSAIERLHKNAQILASKELLLLCKRWQTLLNSKNALTKLKKEKTLLKNTHKVIHAVESYAETI